jgi:hypothetical protein
MKRLFGDFYGRSDDHEWKIVLVLDHLVFALLPLLSKNSSLLRDLLLSKRPPQMVIHSNIVSKRLRQEIIEIPDTRNN